MSFLQNLKKILDRNNFPIWGILASAVALSFVLGSMIGYSGREGEPYSILNHFISELGELGVSHLALLFNLGLIIAGILYIPFIIGLGYYIKNKLGKIALILGVFTAVACSLVGFFPMNFLFQHSISALMFFYGGMLTVAVFTIAIFIEKDSKIPKLFCVFGALVVVFFNTFIFFINWGDVGFDLSSRPAILLLAIFEWAVYFSVIGFLLLIALYLQFKKDKSA